MNSFRGGQAFPLHLLGAAAVRFAVLDTLLDAFHLPLPTILVALGDRAAVAFATAACAARATLAVR